MSFPKWLLIFIVLKLTKKKFRVLGVCFVLLVFLVIFGVVCACVWFFVFLLLAPETFGCVSANFSHAVMRKQ